MINAKNNTGAKIIRAISAVDNESLFDVSEKRSIIFVLADCSLLQSNVKVNNLIACRYNLHLIYEIGQKKNKSIL